MTLPGVGRKTANLVLILAFKSQQNICVDTHVHRIANRLGWVRTRTPEETEQALYKATDAQWWPYINLYLVTWGQNVCRPVYPRCGGLRAWPGCVRESASRKSLAGFRQPKRGQPREASRAFWCWCGCSRLRRCMRRSCRLGQPKPHSGDRRRDVEGHVRVRNVPERGAEDRRAHRGARPKGFYDGQRVHRALAWIPRAVRRSADRAILHARLWGRGAAASSGTPIGVAEITKKRLHQAGAVGVAHMGNPAKADSQIYITLAPRPDLDGQYAVFGQRHRRRRCAGNASGRRRDQTRLRPLGSVRSVRLQADSLPHPSAADTVRRTPADTRLRSARRAAA